MAASNNRSIRELALAVLTRQHVGDETPRETTVRQGVLRTSNVSPHCETPFIESDQAPNLGVSLSHLLGRETLRHRENRETPRETAVRLPGGFPFAEALSELERECPDYVEAERWRQCLIDAQRFLAEWGKQAESLGWASRDLFGLAPVPDKPGANFQRLSRYDLTGLIWLLRGDQVVALTEATAAIRHETGNITTYRRFHKPAFGPLGDSLDDMEVCR